MKLNVTPFVRRAGGFFLRRSLACLLPALLGGAAALPAHAQLTVTSTAPARLAPAVPVASSVGITFSQAPTAASAQNIKVFGSQRGPRTSGPATVSGTTATLPFPGGNFLAGEVVSVSVPNTVLGAGGTAATPYVYQFTTAAAAAAGVFQNRQEATHLTTSVPSAPLDVTVADMNGDGLNDVVFLRDNSLAVRLGLGGGSFATTVYYPLNATTNALAVGDVTGDGRLDAVTLYTNSTATYLQVLPGTATGFGTVATYYQSYPAAYLALGDINADGRLDVVTSNTSYNTISVLLASGTSFSTRTYATGSAPRTLALGDINNDGRLDAVVSTSTGYSTLLGTSTGSNAFSDKTDYAASRPEGVLLRDMTNDGQLDLVSFAASSRLASVQPGQPGGVFGAAQPYDMGQYLGSLTVGDLNGDGRLDLASVSLIPSGGPDNIPGLGIRLSTGASGFGPATVYTTSPSAGYQEVAIGDLDGDSQLDVVTTGAVRNSSISYTGFSNLFFNGAAIAPAISSLAPATALPGSTTTINGSSLQGVSSVTFTSFNGTTVAATGFLPNAAGTQITNVVVPATAQSGPLTVTAVGGTATATFTLTNPAFTLLDYTPGPETPLATGTPLGLKFSQMPTVASLAGIKAYGVNSGTQRAVGAATVNGLDAAVPLAGAAFGPGEVVQVVLPPTVRSSTGATLPVTAFTVRTASGTASGGFANRTDSNTSNSKFMTVGDVTGDGELDVITANLNNYTVSVMPGTGQGTFGPKVNYTTAQQPVSVTLGDVNGDGRTDIVTANIYAPFSNSGNTLTIMLAKAGGGFDISSCVTTEYPTRVALTDIDGNGTLDAIVSAAFDASSTGSGTVNVMRNTGNPANLFTSIATYAVGSSPNDVTLGDVNNDGRLDIVTTNELGQNVSVLLGQAGGTYAAALNYYVGFAPQRSILGDINRDGYLDIATVNFGGSSTINGASIAVLLGNGNGTFGARTVYNGGNYTFQEFDMNDLNGDGYLDLVTASSGPNSAPLRQVLVNLGTAYGTFGPATVYQSAGRPGSVRAADINHDNILDLVVANPDAGTGSTSVFFGVLVPSISSFTPLSGPAGTTVTINGTNLNNASQVTINGVAVAAGFVVNAAGTQITGVLVPAQAQTGPLSVTTPGGTATAAAYFIVPAPAYDECASALELSPAGTCTPTLGNLVMATQSQAPTACSGLTSTAARDVWFSFVANGLTPTVRATSAFDGVLEVFNGTCGSLTSRTCANAVTNAGTNGTETLTLTGLTTGTRYYVRYYPFTSATVQHPLDGSFSICVTVPAPSITSFTPASGSAGTSVTVFGLNFLTATSVTVNGVAITGFTVNAAGNSLTFTLPAGVSTGPIVITTSGGSVTSATSLVVSSPQLNVTQGTTAYPNNGTTPYTFAARATGTVSAATTFTLNNPGSQTLTISSIVATGDFAISGAVPTSVAANGGTAGVGVTFGPTADGTRTGTLVITSNIGTYTVLLAGTAFAPPPFITAFSPSSAAPGSTVTVSGGNLNGLTSLLLGSTTVTGAVVAPNGASLTFVVPAGAGSGLIRVTTPAGTASSSNTLCVIYTPTVQDGSACAGNSVTLQAFNGQGFTYNWYTSATSTTPIFASTSGTFTTPVLNTTTPYYVAVNSGGSCEGNRVVVTALINALPTLQVTASGPTTLCAGSSVTLTASGASSYLWSTGAITASITVAASGTYTVSGNGANGCPAAPVATTITVTPTPAAPTVSGASRCGPGAVALQASGAPAGGSYAWYAQATGGTAIAGATGGSYTTPSLSSSTSYYVSALTSNGCSGPRQAVVATINPVPTVLVSASGPTSFCQGGSVTLTASGASTYQWSTGATTASITVNTSGNYSVTGTGTGNCSAISAATTVTVNALPTATIAANGPTNFCQGGSVTLTANGGSSYVWSTGATTASITVSTGGSYSVTAANAAGCSATSATTAVTVNALPTATVTASGPTNFCQGGSVTLTASGGNSYLWSTGATTASIVVASSGSYSVTAVNAGGCSAASAATAVAVAPAPATPTITQSSPGVLSSSSATGNQWYLDNRAIAGATGATYVVPGTAGNGSYTLVVTSASGCASAASAPLVVTILAAAAPAAVRNLLEVFPNPATGYFTVRVATGHAATAATLYNALGQSVRTLPRLAADTIVDVRDLPSGIYTLRVLCDGQPVMKRITVE